MIAEGKADIYYQQNPTMEWDITAGHAILESAGGSLFIGATPEKVFLYNKKNLRNSEFLALGSNY